MLIVLRRILPILFVFLYMSYPAYGQGPPPDVLDKAVSRQEQIQQEQDRAAHALEKEKAAPNKIGNITGGSFVETFKKGGIIMYFILACSIIGVYITIEKSFALLRNKILPKKFINNILGIVSNAPPRYQQSFQPPPPYPSGNPSVGNYPPPPPSEPAFEQQDNMENETETFFQESPDLNTPPPEPEPVSGEDPPSVSAPAELDADMKEDMDHLLNILNKGLGEESTDSGSEESPQSPPQSGPVTTDYSDPGKGSGSQGSGSTPMNMSYPAGSYDQGGYPPGYGPPDVVDQIIDYCEGKNIPLARVLKSGLIVYSEGILSMKSAITNANIHEGAIMEKGVGVLGVLANVAPLLGLLGTVTGMIKAFEMISVGGTGRPEIVASGIAEALTTTAGGLLVGIPLLLLFHWLQGKIENMLIDLQEFSVDVVEKIIREGK